MEIYRMKKSLLAIAALTAFAGAAQAQSSVTIYGILDMGVGGQASGTNMNSGNGGAPFSTVNPAGVRNGSTFGLIGNGQSASRLGFKGAEDLGGGAKAVFTLEMGMNLANGDNKGNGLAGNGCTNGNANCGADSSSQGMNQLWSRQAFMGLESANYGNVYLGRQYTLMQDNIAPYNPVDSYTFSPIGISGQYGGAGNTDMAVANSALKYKNNIAGVNVNVLAASGGYAGSQNAGSRYEANIGWEKPTYGLQALYAKQFGSTVMAGVTATGAAGSLLTPGQLAGTSPIVPANAISQTWSDTNAWQFTARWTPMDKLNLMAGFQHTYIGQASNYQYYINSPVTVGGLTVASNTNTSVPSQNNFYWFGGTYQITPTIKGSLGYYQQNFLATATQSTVAGTRNAFESAMVEYYLSKRTNLYAALMNTNSKGSKVVTPASGSMNPAVQNGQFSYGLGVRHSF
jgi:predicted porin